VCGEGVLFDEFTSYPVTAFSWATVPGNPSLAEAHRRTGRAVVGGFPAKPGIGSATTEALAGRPPPGPPGGKGRRPPPPPPRPPPPHHPRHARGAAPRGGRRRARDASRLRPATMSLLDKSEFVGLERVTHLATGGEAPWLRSHDQVTARMGAFKSGGMGGRE